MSKLPPKLRSNLRERFLHCHSTFDPGGKELRAVRLMNAFAASAEHTIVSSMPGALGAAAFIDKRVIFDLPSDFPPLTGKPFPARLFRLAQAMVGYDLILTYNFGAMDAVLAHTLFKTTLNLAPLVHHEDGFNEDEIHRRFVKRNLYRRLALGRASALVVCSHMLETIAQSEWHQPLEKIIRISNGIDTARYGQKPHPDALPGLIKRDGEKWLGTLAGLRPVKNLPRLVRAFASLPDDWHLVILGQGSEAETIRNEARALGICTRVHLPGHIAEPAQVLGLFDLFALSSDSEQFPISLIEAMATGLAVAATDVGDVRMIVGEENQAFLVPATRENALARALLTLAKDDVLRNRIGKANHTRARKGFDEEAMISAWYKTYARVLGRDFR